MHSGSCRHYFWTLHHPLLDMWFIFIITTPRTQCNMLLHSLGQKMSAIFAKNVHKKCLHACSFVHECYMGELYIEFVVQGVSKKRHHKEFCMKIFWCLKKKKKESMWPFWIYKKLRAPKFGPFVQAPTIWYVERRNIITSWDETELFCCERIYISDQKMCVIKIKLL